MRIPRILDVVVFLLLVVAVLLPRPDVTAKPALVTDAAERERVAELQSVLLARPGAVDPALELGDLFLGAHRPDWTLAVLAPAIAAAPNDHRLHGLRALALADDFESGAAYRAAERAVALCSAGSSAPCGSAEAVRLGLAKATLARIKDIDMRKDPNAAKENLLKTLRPTFLPRR